MPKSKNRFITFAHQITNNLNYYEYEDFTH